MLGAIRAMQQDAGQPSWALLMGDFNSIPGSAIYRCCSPGLGMQVLPSECIHKEGCFSQIMQAPLIAVSFCRQMV